MQSDNFIVMFLHLFQFELSCIAHAWVCAKLLQSCLVLCNPTDYSAQNSYVHGILQGRILEWVSMSFSSVWHISVQFSSVAQLCPTLFHTMNCSMPGLPVHHQLPEFTQTMWMGELDCEESWALKKLMLLKCGVGEDSWESLELQGDPTSPFWRRSALGVLWKEWC